MKTNTIENFDQFIHQSIKNEIQKKLGVVPMDQFDVKTAISDRVDYLKNYLRNNNLKAIVLGISGGVDSTTAGRLSQIAVNELRDEGYDAKFVAVRLPHNVQKDEDEAQDAINFICADVKHTINIGKAVDAINIEGINSFSNKENFTDKTIDFHKGNIKARMRMIAQYQLAGLYGGVVLGTDHNAENLAGFYTKGGDGFCDLIVLNGLNKRQVRLIAKELGAPEWLWSKVATADLEELNEQVPDEVALGVTYEDMDDFLEGKEISEDSEIKIVNQYQKTQHKRELPVTFFKLNLSRN